MLAIGRERCFSAWKMGRGRSRLDHSCAPSLVVTEGSPAPGDPLLAAATVASDGVKQQMPRRLALMRGDGVAVGMAVGGGGSGRGLLELGWSPSGW